MKTDKIFIAAALLASGSAQSASLEAVQGEVWVGREKGYSIVQGAAELSPGDRVKVGRKGFARLVYPDGCNVSLKENSLAAVAQHSPCSFRAQAGGSTQGDNPATGDGGFNPGLLAFGAGLAGAAAGGAVAATSSSNQGSGNQELFLLLVPRPASP